MMERDNTTRTIRPLRRQLRVIALVAGLLLGAAGIGACGQVITVTPTPTPAPTATIGVALALSTPPPTFTPAPFTPEPTATPTVTPTPVVHLIASGESLLAVADRYGISVATLQEANGILDPRSLQVGQELVIPREEEFSVEEEATPTPTPLAMTIANLHFSETSIGGLWVMGEVLNDTDTALEQVRVGVRLVDAEESELATAETLVVLDLIDIDERAPFAVLFDSAPEAFDRYQAYVLSAVPAYMGSYYRDLEVRDLEGVSEGVGSYIVNGRLFNFGPEEAVEAQVVLTAYDPLGRVIAMRKIDPEHNVVPVGGETEFSAVLAPVGGPVDRVDAVGLGRRISAASQP